MPEYKISENAKALISSQVRAMKIESFNELFYPAVMWTLGGTMTHKDGTIHDVHPHYALAYINKNDIGRMFSIQSAEFGLIGFEPSEEDKNSPSFLVDYVGGELVLRA